MQLCGYLNILQIWVAQAGSNSSATHICSQLNNKQMLYTAIETDAIL